AGAVEAYRWMGLHVQTSPLFPNELEGWKEAQAIARGGPGGPVIGGLEPVATMARSVGAAGAIGAVGSVGPVRPGAECAAIGRWTFAALPGRIYNEPRARVLEQISLGQAPGIRALVFRKVPVAAALATGVGRHVLKYVYLGE